MKLLKIGSMGSLVRLLQSRLKQLNLYQGNIDGIFGPNTEASVISFQKRYNLIADGIVGTNTWQKLYEVVSIVPTDISYNSIILNSNLIGLKTIYPFLDISNIGYSVLGTPLHLIKIGKGQKEIFYSAAIHANEWITSPILMKFIEDFSKAYINNSNIYGYNARNLFDNVSLYIVPMCNPDGVDLVTGVFNYNSPIFRNFENIASSFPSIAFVSGWKANFNGVDFSYFHIILKKYDFLSRL